MGQTQGTPGGSPAQANNGQRHSGSPASPGPAVQKTYLNISGQDLSGDRLQQFAKENDLMLYQNLAVLNASNCRLENVEFVTTWIATLKDLDISRNLITTMENQNEMLFFVKNLVRLDMSFNFLTSMPLLFCNLVNLHTLNLSNNNVTTMCTEMGMIEGLTDLDVSCNQLAKVPPELGQCRHLTKLKLNQNRLKELPESLGQLDSLVVLILTDNFLTKIPSSFGKMTSLRKLYLDNNELTHVPTELSGAILLRELNLNNNQLVDLPRALTKLTNMTLLDLSENLFGEEKAIVLTTIGDLKAVLDKTSASKLSSAARQARGKKKTGRDTLRVPNASRPTIDGLSSGNSSPVLSRHSSVGSNTPSPAPVNRFAFAKLFRFMSITYMKEVIVDQVALAAASINEGDVFLLDLQESIYIYIGDASDPRERAKALSVANTIARDTGVPEEQLVIIEGKGKHKWASTMDFWQALGALEEGDIKKVSKHIKPAGDSDSQFIIRVTETRMWRFGEDEGDRASIAILGDGEPLVKTLLDSSSAFVIDTIGPTVYVWCGQYASPSSRSWALLKAEELVTRSEREEVGERNVMWVVDEAEAWDFKEQFFDWMDEVWDPEKQAHLEKEREVAAEAMRLMEQERREEEQAAAAAAAAAADDSEDEADTSSQEEPEHAKDEQVAEYVKAMATPVIARVTTPRLDEIKHARVPSNPIPVVPATDPTAEAMAKLAKRMPKMNASPAMPADLGKRVQFFEVAERVHTKVLREGALARARQEPSKGRARPQLQHTLSGFIEVPEAVRETALLTGPRRAAAPSRRKATKNPLKARAEMEEAAAAEAASNQPDAAATAAAAAEKEARLRAAGGGGMGFGKGVLAEAESLFQKKRIAAESGESVNTIGEDAIAKKGQPRLLHIKGRRKLIVKQVEVAASSLNDGDVFALDTGRGVLYQWNGAKANRIEKGKAMDVLKNIKDKEMNGQAKVIVLEQGQESDQANGFWNLLGGKPASIASGDSAGDDENVDALLKEFTNLYKLVESTDPSAAPVSTAAARRGSARRAAPATSVHPELVAKYPLQKEMLEHEFCYLLDSVCEMYVWCGNKTSMDVRRKTIKIAEDLRASRDYWVAPICRELPGGETVLFREKFANWGYGPPIQMQQIAVGKNVAKVGPSETIDVIALHKKTTERPEVHIDDGMGKKRIWRIVDFKKEAVPESEHGHFFASDSYIILYSYLVRNKEMHMIYYWQGLESTTNEKGASALLTIELGEEVAKGNTKEIRVAMNQEPRHFLLLFKENYIIHSGKAVDQPKTPALYHVTSSSASAPYTKCIQLGSTYPTAFVSTGAFVVVSSDKSIIWVGKAAAEHEIAYSKSVEPAISRRYRSSPSTPTIVNEGKEKKDFWAALGSSATNPFPCVPIDRAHPVRLYQSSESTGQHRVWEVPAPFSQDDLTRHDVFILDTWYRVFIWQQQASASDRKKAMEVAVNYATSVQDGRPKDCPVLLVTAKEEPLMFINHFHAWRPIPKDPSAFVATLKPAAEELAKFTKSYTYQELVDKKFPAGLDTTKLDTYLSDEEFEEVFEMTREVFATQPVWKQQKLKRDKQLF